MKMLKKLIGLAVAVSSTGAFAQSAANCSFILQQYSSNPSSNAIYLTEYPECFAGGSTASTTQISGTSFTQANAIFQALGSRNRQATPGPVAAFDTTGLAAGGANQAWNAWASHTAVTSSVQVNNGANRNDTDIGTTVIGGDYSLSPLMTVGVSASFDRADGSSLAGVKSKITGYSIAPYLSYQISKSLALDVSAGFGAGEFSVLAIRADADRWFAGANLSYAQWMDKVQLTGKLGYLHGEEKYEDSKANGVVRAGTGAKNKVDQLRAGVRASYWMDGVMPYAGLTYSTDVHRANSLPVGVDPLGRQAFVLAVGADFFSLSSKITGGISYESEQGRTNSNNDVLTANINIRF